MDLADASLVVAAEPGTTRDAIDTPFEYEGNAMLLVDTAGIRRRGKIERESETGIATRAFYCGLITLFRFRPGCFDKLVFPAKSRGNADLGVAREPLVIFF
jgi:hypothetical protein